MGISNLSTLSSRFGPSTKLSRHTFIDFQGIRSQAALSAVGAVAAVGVTDGNINQYVFGNQGELLHTVIGTTAAVPLTKAGSAAGVLLAVDATDDEGLELTPHYISASAGTLLTAFPGRFVARTDEFYFRLKFKILTAVLGADFIAVGFRKVETIQNVFTAYADYFALNVNNGAIRTLNELGGAGATDTDSTQTWVNGDTHTLEVRVSSTGFARGFVDGAGLTVNPTAVYRFADGLAVMPVFHLQLDVTALDPVITLLEWESGLFSDRGLDNINDLTAGV